MHPVRSRLLPELAQEAILAHIDEAGLGPGDALPSEKGMSEQLELSRPSLREGLAFLRRLGLIESGRRRGMSIARPHPFRALNVFRVGGVDKQTVIEWCELRLMLEVGAIQLACNRIDNAGLDRLERLCAEEIDAIGNQDRIAAIDYAFHSTLIAAANNSQATDLGEALLLFFDTDHYREAFQVWHERKLPVQSDHRPLVEALRSRDPLRCSELMYNHLVVHTRTTVEKEQK
jgi:GntR family transcriptional repressor for pyruvate dehydrogenase complex